MTPKPEITVIIPTFNEAGSVLECLNSLAVQKGVSFEVMVVDDGSTDQTLGVLKGLPADGLRLRVLNSSHGGAGAARNIGAKKSLGEILVFVDADMTFDAHFLEKLTGHIRKKILKGTFSKDEHVANWNNVWARCWNINEGWETERRHPKNYPDHQPVFRAILKSEFNKAGGFSPGGYDDDWSLSKKLGYEAVASPGALFFHKNPSSLSEVFGHARWVAKRKYKFGFVGFLFALVRASLPVSILVGIYKSFASGNFSFLIFKVVYDFGIFAGILEFLLSGKGSK